MHKNQIEWFKVRLGVNDYGIVWIAFIKGLIFGLLLNFFCKWWLKMKKIIPMLVPIFLISCTQAQIQQTQALICNFTLDESLASCAN